MYTEMYTASNKDRDQSSEYKSFLFDQIKSSWEAYPWLVLVSPTDINSVTLIFNICLGCMLKGHHGYYWALKLFALHSKSLSLFLCLNVYCEFTHMHRMFAVSCSHNKHKYNFTVISTGTGTFSSQPCLQDNGVINIMHMVIDVKSKIQLWWPCEFWVCLWLK